MLAKKQEQDGHYTEEVSCKVGERVMSPIIQ